MLCLNQEIDTDLFLTYFYEQKNENMASCIIFIRYIG